MRLFANKYESFNACLKNKIPFIPIGETNYVPQGVCAVGDYLIVTCYDALKENNSILYIYGKDYYKSVYLDCKMHAGGICYHEKSDSIFITGRGVGNRAFINKYSAKKILNAKDLSTVFVEKVYCVDEDNLLYSTSAKHSSVAYITCYEDDIYLGNYLNFNYLKPGVVKKFKVLANGDISKRFAIRDNHLSNTQGLCIYEYKGKKYYIFSRSFGMKRNSLINICIEENDEFKCVNTIVLPCMAEQISVYKKKIVIIFESCAKKYKRGALSVCDGIYMLNFKSLLECNDDNKCFKKGSSIFKRDKGIAIN